MFSPSQGDCELAEDTIRRATTPWYTLHTGALDFPSNIKDIREIEIGGPSRIRDSLTILSSNKLLDPLIT